MPPSARKEELANELSRGRRRPPEESAQLEGTKDRGHLVKMRVIQEFMTRSPVPVSPDTPVPGAHALMRNANVRHLVVLDGDRLVGLVSQRDLYLIETLVDADPQDALVEEAMTAKPYAVTPDTPLEVVARTMWRQRYGAALVVDEGHVVGIFTATDALRALAELLSLGSDDVETLGASLE